MVSIGRVHHIDGIKDKVNYSLVSFAGIWVRCTCNRHSRCICVCVQIKCFCALRKYSTIVSSLFVLIIIIGNCEDSNAIRNWVKHSSSARSKRKYTHNQCLIFDTTNGKLMSGNWINVNWHDMGCDLTVSVSVCGRCDWGGEIKSSMKITWFCIRVLILILLLPTNRLNSLRSVSIYISPHRLRKYVFRILAFPSYTNLLACYIRV